MFSYKSFNSIFLSDIFKIEYYTSYLFYESSLSLIYLNLYIPYTISLNVLEFEIVT